jgi:hypothetical protein
MTDAVYNYISSNLLQVATWQFPFRAICPEGRFHKLWKRGIGGIADAMHYA